MIVDRPWALALLAAVPVLWWLHRRRTPRVVRVASVTPYRTSEGSPPPAAERRGADRVLALLCAGAAALSVAAAGLRLGRDEASVRVVVDSTPSMDALLAAPLTGTVSANAGEHARHLLAQAEPDASVAPGPPSAGADQALAAARADGFSGIVFVTDHVPPAVDPDVVCVGPTGPALPNLAVADVARDGDAALVSVANSGDAPRSVRVVVFDAAGREVAAAAADVPPRGRAALRVPGPPSGSAAWRIALTTSPADALRGDDEVRIVRRGGARSARIEGDAPPVAAALRALGVSVQDGPGADVTVRVGGALADGRAPTVHLAPEPASSGGPLRTVAAPRSVDAATLVRRGDAPFPLPAPSARLSATCRVQGGTTLLEDAAGPLVVRSGAVVVVALDPRDAASDWVRDGSFVAALGTAIDLVTGGPDRIEIVGGFPAGESDVAHDPPPDPSPADLRRIVRHAFRGTDVSAALALAGAAAILLAVGCDRRR